MDDSDLILEMDNLKVLLENKAELNKVFKLALDTFKNGRKIFIKNYPSAQPIQLKSEAEIINLKQEIIEWNTNHNKEH